jgi:hypothetical protein
MTACTGVLDGQVVLRRIIMKELCAQDGGFIYPWRECVKGFHDLLKIQASSLFMLANGKW